MANSENWIKQIATGGVTYDIAVAHGLTFKTGTKTQSWDGISDVEVVIPTLSDLVSSPIVFAGTVDETGTINWAKPYTQAQKGYLVYIQKDCTFAGEVCEAGDMAVYDDTAWRVISGENQVSIKAGSTPVEGATAIELSVTAKSVLYVEGKELALKLPAELLKGVDVTKNADKVISFNEGAIAAVDGKYITLTHTPAAEDTAIGSNKTIALPTALAKGEVNFTGDTKLVKPSDITAAWTAGTNGKHQSAEVSVTVSGNVTLTKGTGEDFVTGWTPTTDSFVKSAVKSATLSVVTSKKDNETIAVNPFVASNPTFSNDATLFGTSIVTAAADADFTIPGAVSVSTESAQPSINGVVIGVTLPKLSDAPSFTDANYVAADSATGVIASIANPTVTVNNGNVIASATVSNNVLTFTTATVTATATQGTATYKKAQYKKTVVSNTPGISYGSIQTAAGKGYKLDKQAVNATFTPGAINYMGVKTSDVTAADKASAYTGLTATKGAYTAALTAAGTIASGDVITSVTDATVPVLATISATGSISGSVATALTTSNVKVGVFASDSASINIGTWALGESEKEVSGGIAVGKNGQAQVTGAITIVSGTYVTDVSGVKLA